MRVWSLAGLALIIIIGCAPIGHESSSRCDVTSLQDVFRDPPRYFGKRFCGMALAVPEGRVLKIFPPSEAIPEERNDVVMFLDVATADALNPRNRLPFRFYMEGVIGGMEECFESSTSEMQSICTPFRHPLDIRVSRYRRSD